MKSEHIEFNHKSVLLDEVIENLQVKPDGIYVDGTLGGGGHAYHVCKKLGDNGRFIGIDQDGDAIKAASNRLAEFQDKVTIVRNNYCNMKSVLDSLGIDKVDGILLDLGVSSYQLDTVDRGFSYKEKAQIGKRKDTSGRKEGCEKSKKRIQATKRATKAKTDPGNYLRLYPFGRRSAGHASAQVGAVQSDLPFESGKQRCGRDCIVVWSCGCFGICCLPGT